MITTYKCSRNALHDEVRATSDESMMKSELRLTKARLAYFTDSVPVNY